MARLVPTELQMCHERILLGGTLGTGLILSANQFPCRKPSACLQRIAPASCPRPPRSTLSFPCPVPESHEPSPSQLNSGPAIARSPTSVLRRPQPQWIRCSETRAPESASIPVPAVPVTLHGALYVQQFVFGGDPQHVV